MKNKKEEVTKWWWLAPIFLSIIGGLIAWFVNRNKDPRKAKKMLALGVVLFIPMIAINVYRISNPEAKFQVENLSVSSSKVAQGESVIAQVKVANVGDGEGTYTVNLEVGGETLEEKVTLSPNKSKTVSFNIEKQEKGTYNLDVGGLSENFEVVEPAEFEVSNLNIASASDISVEVSNTGDLTGENTIKLVVDGTVKDTQTVSLDGGKSETVNFSVSDLNEGSHNVSVGYLSGTVDINFPPTASASADTTSGLEPLVVNFTGSGSDAEGTIESYSWDFGDGSTSSNQNTSHTFDSEGDYEVTLTVTDDEGSTASDTVTISVSGQPEWVHTKTYVAATDYYYNNWSIALPQNADKYYTIDYYYSYDETFTDHFGIQGDKFKVEYQAGGDYQSGSGMIFTYPKGTDINYVDARSVSGTLSEGTYTVDEGPGTYYFVFSGEYMDYFTVKVYDWR